MPTYINKTYNITHEEADLQRAKQLYVDGTFSIEELEEAIERILNGELLANFGWGTELELK